MSEVDSCAVADDECAVNTAAEWYKAEQLVSILTPAAGPLLFHAQMHCSCRAKPSLEATLKSGTIKLNALDYEGSSSNFRRCADKKARSHHCPQTW